MNEEDKEELKQDAKILGDAAKGDYIGAAKEALKSKKITNGVCKILTRRCR